MDSPVARRVSATSSTSPTRKQLPPSQIESCETTYRDLLGSSAWARLEPEVRQRFSVKPWGRNRILYHGVMARVELSFMGWLFAQACRLIGTPLALFRGTDIKMDIELAWNEALHGVTWRRTYHFEPNRKFTVSSTKSRGLGGELIEHIGRGFSMHLALSERCGALVFTSTRYEFEIRGRRIRIPAFLTPGVTTVTHEQIAGDRFRFSLSVVHPYLGRTIFQDGEFRAVPVCRRQ